ncbi:MAG: type II toxin-antitoxin system PemK/MazF family toxin [Ruminococcus sp.]|nr:type II toxin-antitoxin system PemK/MazF family toxin [Ruminococcus sp.]
MNIDLSKAQAHLDWLKQKLFLDETSKNANKRVVKRGQVYNCELGMGIGSELQKKRPCIIIQNDKGNTHSAVTTIVPITHTQKPLNCFVPISNKYDKNGTLILDGLANVSAIRSVDKARLSDYICDLEQNELKDIDKAIAINIDIFKHYLKLQNMYNDKLDYIVKLNTIIKEIKELLNIDDNKKIIEEIKKILDNNNNS